MTENHLVRCVLIACLGVGLASNLCAQETPQLLRVRLEDSKEPLAPINLRPNTLTTVGIYLQNPTRDDFRNVTVKLVQVEDDKFRVIAQAEAAKVAPKAEVRLAFVKTNGGADKVEPKAKDAGDKKDAADKMELAGPPFRMQLWVEPKQKDDFAPIKRDLDLIIREPRDYVAATAQVDIAKRKLLFKAALAENDNLIGPQKCPVELVLGPEFGETKKGTFLQPLLGPKQEVELFAEDLTFAGPKIRAGRAYLNVDGYERAFIYPVTLAGPGGLSEISFGKKVGAGIRVPRYAKPNAAFPVHLELDGPLDADYRVEVALDRAGTKERFPQVVNLTGLRQQKARLGVSAAGDLLCQTEVRDWQIAFDTTGVFGNLWLRLAVFKKNGKSGKYEEVELLTGDEARPGLASMEIDVESKRLFARVTQDESRPEEIEFVDLPREWAVGKPLLVQARVRKRDAVQAPIDKVTLLRGKVPADGKINPDTILGAGAFDARTEAWSIVLPAQDKIEPMEISVQFVTKTGAVGAKSATISFNDPTAGGKGIATVKGKITHGPIAQPNLAVALYDDKGQVKGSQKTDAKGEFAFEKVPPGNYVISSMQAFPALVGQTKVEVPAGKELIENVTVRLLAK